MVSWFEILKMTGSIHAVTSGELVRGGEMGSAGSFAVLVISFTVTCSLLGQLGQTVYCVLPVTGSVF